MRGAMSKQVPDVVLRVWTPRHATVKFVKQVAPRHRRPDRPPLRAGPAGRGLPDRRLGTGGES
jgi:hypothetical protein